MSDKHMRRLRAGTGYRFQFRWIGTYSGRERKVRLIKLMWSTGRDCTKPGWFSAFLSVSLVPKWFHVGQELWGWTVILMGVRLHHKRAYGGWL